MADSNARLRAPARQEYAQSGGGRSSSGDDGRDGGCGSGTMGVAPGSAGDVERRLGEDRQAAGKGG